jgi:hypothetical protein
VLIVFGILMEKRYVSWWQVLGNVSGLIITLATIDLSPITTVLLCLYVFLGVVCAWKRWRKVYVIFGSKTYGSLQLVLGLFSIKGSYEALNQILTALTIPSQTNITLFFASWIIIVVIAQIVGWYINRVQGRRNRR